MAPLIPFDFSAQEAPPVETAPQVWRVAALCRAVGELLDVGFAEVRVQGEISGAVRSAAGHVYFSLKDDAAQLRCVMFRRSVQSAGVVPRDGAQVVVRGGLSVYAARGDLQLIVEELEAAGQGALYERFLRLKAKLQEEGMFDAARKRRLVRVPIGVGVVTSTEAAALHDVLTTLARRAPHVPIVLSPASVQGSGAADTLIAALRRLYLRRDIDTILLVRGGGSVEDLWAFNDERLVRTVAASPLPIVTGVGHESDFTLVDFAADVRAPTPTAAAEMAAAARDELLAQLLQIRERLRRRLTVRLGDAAQRLDGLRQRWHRIGQRGRERRQAFDMLRRTAAILWTHRREHEHRRLRRQRERLDRALQIALHAALRSQPQRVEALQTALHRALQRRTQQLHTLQLRLHALDPDAPLQRGYARLENADGAPLTAAAQTRVGAIVTARLRDGRLDLQVTGVERRSS